jgi:hypothetical protein
VPLFDTLNSPINLELAEALVTRLRRTSGSHGRGKPQPRDQPPSPRCCQPNIDTDRDWDVIESVAARAERVRKWVLQRASSWVASSFSSMS